MTERPEEAGVSSDDERWPIGFMVFVGLAGLYLVVRLIQMAGWVVGRLF